MDQLQGKIVLVTGGGSGINLAFTKLLYEAGCRITIADIALHKQAEEWLSSIGPADGKVHFQKTDVTDWTQLEAAFDATVEKFSDVPDVVVPGAGIYEPSHNTFWADTDEASHYKILDVNLVHPIKTTRIAIRRMLKAGKGGAIIHVSSIAGQYGSIVTPLYAASKHGVSSFIRGMALLDGICGIRVVGVAPGTVGTPLFSDSPAAMKYLDPSKDFLLPPEEIARAMMALLTDASYPPGTILEVCDMGKDKWRQVPQFLNPGPSGPASKVSGKDAAIEDLKRFFDMDRKA